MHYVYIYAATSAGPSPLSWIHIPSRTAWEHSQENDDGRGAGSQRSYLHRGQAQGYTQTPRK